MVVVFVAGPLLSVGAMTAEGESVPFLVQRILAWPGYLWMALFLYLLLAGEAVRPVLRRWFARRSAEELVSADAPLPTPAHHGDPDAARGTAGPVTVLNRPHAPPVGTAPTGPSRRLLVSRAVGGAAHAVAVGTVGHFVSQIRAV